MSLLEHSPRFSEKDAQQFVIDLYGIQASAKSLPSERDQNFLMDAASGGRFVFKIANALEERAILETQNQTMLHLARHVAFCPQVLPTKSQETITEVKSPQGTTHFVRLVSYMPGIPLAKLKRHSSGLLQDLGRCIGQMDRALASFDHPGAHRDLYWDLSNGLRVVKRYQSLIEDVELRKLVESFAGYFEREVGPLLPKLRKCVIHNDANDYNVIAGGGGDHYTRNQRIAGIIDFGDIVYSWTVGDLAIGIAYAVLDKPDPLETAIHVVKGYHAENPLETDEIAALYSLVCMRLCVSVCMAAQQYRQQPDNDYLTISQQPIRNTLPILYQIHPRFAEATFRHACGLSPVKQAQSVRNWLKRHGENMASVMDMDPDTEPAVVFDLSIGSPLVGGDEQANAEPAMTPRLFAEMKTAGAKIGIGRYDEARMIYTSPLFSKDSSPTAEQRTVHIGMDLFAAAGTQVYAPLSGSVHAFARNDAPLDYGPLIILKHRTDAGDIFFTLYGHLSADSIAELQMGRSIEKGEPIGKLGTPDVNGGWTPHLHFQIITDLLDLDCDFPGVVRPSQREVWTDFSPDPNLILRLPARYFPRPEPGKAETLAARKKLIGRNLSIGYRDPIKVLRGWMQYLYDEAGRRYVDAYNNVPHVGHCHPYVVEAARTQMAVLNTNTRYLHDFINRYARRLCATLPDPLNVCFFVNSASEGNELALRLARSYTRQRDMIVLEAAYHGHTTSMIDISPYKHDGPGGNGAPPWVHTAPIPDVYRGMYKTDEPQVGLKYARHVQELIENLNNKGTGLAGFIAESCPSVAGQIFLPEGYLCEVYRHVRAAGGVCIADEVQTGYGRIGTHFYAFEAQEAVPDIVVLGKPIGNGHPISAVITTAEIADAFDNGMEFFSTFGGNTVSCAVGLAVLEVLQKENLQNNALRVGRRLLEGLNRFKDHYPIVGDVRGCGLFLGVELVRDRKTLVPATEETSYVVDRMREHGILLGIDGPYHNVIKIRPPMPFSAGDADLLVAAMDNILEEDFSG